MRKAEQKDGCGWAELIIASVRGDKELDSLGLC